METKTKPKLNISEKIKSLKVGESFIVKTRSQRIDACRIAKTLVDAGIIKFDVITRKVGDGTFKVAAI